MSAVPPPKKNAFVRESCSVPRSAAWNRAPRAAIHGTHSAERAATSRASASSVSPSLARSRSASSSSSGYASVSSCVGAACAQRKLRVWRLLPPRSARGAHSSTSTRAPSSRAVTAAQSPALPPPMTRTSYCAPALFMPPPTLEHERSDERDERGRDQRRGNWPRDEHAQVAFADRDGAAELLLGHWTEHEPEHGRHERDTDEPHPEPEHADDVEQADVEQRAIQAVDTERGEHEHSAEQQRPRHEHHACPDAHERQVQHEQHDVAYNQARDQRPDEIGPRGEEQRAGLKP